jgi:hypothetical protein
VPYLFRDGVAAICSGFSSKYPISSDLENFKGDPISLTARMPFPRPRIHVLQEAEHVAMTESAIKTFDIDQFLHPAHAFQSPQQILKDPDMTLAEKRAVLASWASDACAVEAAPDLRQPPNGPVVTYDEIMDALRTLDGEAAKPSYEKLVMRAMRLKDVFRARGDNDIFLTWPEANNA